jgi:hypothetical protein
VCPPCAHILISILTLWRRHEQDCKAGRAREDRAYVKCARPIWVDGRMSGRRIRESLKTRNWQTATKRINEAEARGTWEAPAEASLSVEDSIAKWKADASARGRQLESIGFDSHPLTARLAIPEMEVKSGTADLVLRRRSKFPRMRSQKVSGALGIRFLLFETPANVRICRKHKVPR